MILSIVVLTGYAGQISLAQWAFAGIGALFAGRFVRADVPSSWPSSSASCSPSRWACSSPSPRCGPAA